MEACGNGGVDAGEDCDASAPGASPCPEGKSCVACQCQGQCGDGVRDRSSEACDDSAADGKCPAGQSCVGCERCERSCGNGFIDDGESCDTASADICGQGFACRDDCTCGVVACGNGILEADEECDHDPLPAGLNFQRVEELCPWEFSACTTLCKCSVNPLCGDGEHRGATDPHQCDPTADPSQWKCAKGDYASTLASCVRGWCECECPPVDHTPCQRPDGTTVFCPSGSSCDPAAPSVTRTCRQDVCPAGATHDVSGACSYCRYSYVEDSGSPPGRRITSNMIYGCASE
jgi:hypothetical protein